MAIPTTEELLPLIAQRRPDFPLERKNEIALRAQSIFAEHQNDKWMNPMLAVKMAIFEPAG